MARSASSTALALIVVAIACAVSTGEPVRPGLSERVLRTRRVQHQLGALASVPVLCLSVTATGCVSLACMRLG